MTNMNFQAKDVLTLIALVRHRFVRKARPNPNTAHSANRASACRSTFWTAAS